MVTLNTYFLFGLIYYWPCSHAQKGGLVGQLVYCKTLLFGSHFILVLLVVKEKKWQNKKQQKKTPVKIKECKRRIPN